MMLLPRPARSALLAVLDVALHARGKPVSSRELAERHRLPPRRLESMLQALVHAGVLRSLRGPSGGYELARERRRLTLAEIVRVAIRAGDDKEAYDKIGPASLEAALAPALEEIEGQIFAQLGSISIDDLYARALANGAMGEETGGDFAI